MLVYIYISINTCISDRYLSCSSLVYSSIVHIRNYYVTSIYTYNYSYMPIYRIISSTTKLNYCSKLWCRSSCMSLSSSISYPLVSITWPVNIFILSYIPSTVSISKSPFRSSPNKLITSSLRSVFRSSSRSRSFLLYFYYYL